MRTAETVLNVIRDRGERGLPLEDIYRQLYNRELYLRAYGRLYSNQGAMTKGTTADTVDGMSLAKIDRLIDALRYERFRWTPVRRVNIPKPNGKTRPLGIPTWTDKLLQEVIRMILEAYYEPQFSDRSHGFRPNRGCHTALGNVVNYWNGVRWFVEGDIKGCFDNIDHEVMLSVLGEKLPRQPLPAPAQAHAESGLHGELEVWPHPERHAARGGCFDNIDHEVMRGQSHTGKYLPGPVGQVRRERAHTSTYPRHSPETQPRVECVAMPHQVSPEHGAPQAGGATAKADAATPIPGPL